MNIIIDTREQLPLFHGQRCKLDVGDYTTQLLWGVYHVERKSLQDLYGTMTRGNVRFHHCIFRAKIAKIKLVMVVEGTKQEFYEKDFPNGGDRGMPGEILIKIVDTFERKYLPVYWCGDRDGASSKILQLFYEEELRIKLNGKAKRGYNSSYGKK